jgi:hypothetical protein
MRKQEETEEICFVSTFYSLISFSFFSSDEEKIIKKQGNL